MEKGTLWFHWSLQISVTDYSVAVWNNILWTRRCVALAHEINNWKQLQLSVFCHKEHSYYSSNALLCCFSGKIHTSYTQSKQILFMKHINKYYKNLFIAFYLMIPNRLGEYTHTYKRGSLNKYSKYLPLCACTINTAPFIVHVWFLISNFCSWNSHLILSGAPRLLKRMLTVVSVQLLLTIFISDSGKCLYII